MHVVHAQNLLHGQALLNCESGVTSSAREQTDVDQLVRYAVVRWHLTVHAADAVVHTSTCIAGSQLRMHYL